VDDLSDADKTGLENLLEGLDVPDSIQILSRFEVEWNAHRAGMPELQTEDYSEAKLTWATENCVSLVRLFLDSQKVFCPLVEIKILPQSKQAWAESLLQKVGTEDADAIQKRIDKTFELLLAQIPASMRVAVQSDYKNKFLLDQYYNIVAEFLEERENQRNIDFAPRIQPTQLSNDQKQSRAGLLLGRIRAKHVPLFKEKVEAEFQSFLKGVPEMVKTDQDSPLFRSLEHAWLCDYYYDILEVVLDTEVFCYTPALSPSVLRSVEAKTKANALVERVEARHVEQIRKTVETAYAKEIAAVPAKLVEEFGDKMYEEWLHSNYYLVLESVLCTSNEVANDRVREPAAETVDQVSDSNVSNAVLAAPCTNMLMSPRKKRNTGPGTAATLEWQSVEQLQTGLWQQTDARKLEAYLIYFPDEVKRVSVWSKRNNSQETISILSFLLVDSTGPIVMDVWREKADALHKDFIAWETGTSNSVLLGIERFVLQEDVREEHRTPLRKLRGNERTCIHRLTQGTQTSVLESRQPNPTLFTRDFSKLAGTPPFSISIAGVVGSMQEETTSQNGNAMKGFQLQDTAGKYVNCTAFGRHVDSEFLADRNEIIIYFAAAKLGLGSGPGQLWLFDDCHVACVRKNCTVPAARTLVPL
jgi:hypothetical protein